MHSVGSYVKIKYPEAWFELQRPHQITNMTDDWK